jgi:hypothetical protein
VTRRDAFPLPPSDLQSGNVLREGTMPRRRRVFDSDTAFDELLRCGASFKSLCRYIAFVKFAAEKLAERKGDRSNQKEADRRKRKREHEKILKTLHKTADEIKRLNNESNRDLRGLISLINENQPKTDLRTQIMAAKTEEGRMTSELKMMLSRFLELPDLLEMYANFIQSRFRGDVPSQSKLWYSEKRKKEGLNRAMIGFVNYVKEVTGRPHFPEVTSLCRSAMQDALEEEVIFVTDDLKHIYKRNPSLHKSLRISLQTSK